MLASYKGYLNILHKTFLTFSTVQCVIQKRGQNKLKGFKTVKGTLFRRQPNCSNNGFYSIWIIELLKQSFLRYINNFPSAITMSSSLPSY
jgi:hypothetical protein